MKLVRESDRKRVLIVGLGIFFLFSLLIVQFFNIQMVEGEKWAREAIRQHFFTVREPFVRGTFYSNTSLRKDGPEIPQKLVFDIQKFHLYVDPFSIAPGYRQGIIKNLNTILQIPPEQQNNFAAQFRKKSRSRKLAVWLDKEDKEKVLQWWTPYARHRRIPRNALYFVADYQRSYPFGKLLGQVLHTVQDVKNEKTGQAIPTGGLELYFNNYLIGREGKRELMRSPRNSLETGEIIERPQNGADIHLTINHCLQAIAEEELAKGVIAASAKSGWAVMMDPYNGHILALAQYPFFNPEEYKKFFSDPKLIEHTRMKALTDANEPGSVMKPITIATALKANQFLQSRGEPPVFDPAAKTATSNCHFPGRKNLTDTHFHAFLNMEMAIQKSSNIYVARLVDKVIEKLGAHWYKGVLHHTFGFGEKTGVELPSENKGLVPTPGKRHPNGALEWSVPTPFSLAMGHNIQNNSVQLARAYAVFANGGHFVQPTLVRKIVRQNEDGTLETLVDNTSNEREKSFPRVLDEKIAKQIATTLKYTTKPGGTGRRADILGYTEGGKSGTAQKIVGGTYSQTVYCSTFVGIAPISQPVFVLAVTVDEPKYGFVEGIGKIHHGGTCSAPIFREIGKRALEYLGIPPDDPFGYPVGDPRHHAEKADWVLETRRLQEMYEKWNNSSERVK